MKNKVVQFVAVMLLICGVSKAGIVELSRIEKVPSGQEICEGEMYSHRVQVYGAYVGCTIPMLQFSSSHGWTQIKDGGKPLPIEVITDYYATKQKIHDEMWLLQGRVKRPGRGKYLTVRGPCGAQCYMHEARPNGSYTLVNLRKSQDHVVLGGREWQPEKIEHISAKVRYPDEIRIENGQIIGGPEIAVEGCVNITIVENTVGLEIKSGKMCDVSAPIGYKTIEKKWGRIDGKVIINAEIV